MTPASLSNGASTVGLVFQVALACALASRRVWARFPLFTAYALFNLFETGVGYMLDPRSSLYFYFYAVSETIAIALGLAVVREIFSHMFSTYPALRRMAILAFRVVLALLVVLGFVVIYVRGPFDKTNTFVGLLVMEEAARILEVGLIAYLFFFSSVFGLHWRQAIFGIALGLGAFAVVKLTTLALVLRSVQAQTVMWFNFAQSMLFDVCLLVWLGYLLAPERATSTSELPQRAQLEQWNKAMMELIHQ